MAGRTGASGTELEPIDDEAAEAGAVAWHALPVEEVAARLGSDPARGLNPAEAARRLARIGPNRLAESPGRSMPSLLLAQLRGPVTPLLLAASGIALGLGERVEAAAILVVVALNAGIGLLMVWRAERALAALRAGAAPQARVIRDGAARRTAAADLVPGDLVALAAGDRIPADGRLVEAVRLRVEEAALTGESLPSGKRADSVADAGAAVGDRKSMGYMGTVVADGRGRMLVTATGPRTEVGRIGLLLEQAGSRETPLDRELDRLGRWLLGLVVTICAVIVLAGLLRGHALLPMLETGISLAIAAVPEGLPAVATLTLAVGVQRMARMRAIVRRLSAVEALGSVTVICADKTGTLTRDEMTVREVVADGRRARVTGAGYAPTGEFLGPDGERIAPRSDPRLALALRIGALCNDARVDRSGGGNAVLGDPTEAALLAAAEKAGMTHEAFHREYPRVDEVPFDSRAKRMVTVHRARGGGLVAFLKGSPGTVLDLCDRQVLGDAVAPLAEADRESHRERNLELAGAAMRVLGLAYRDLREDYVRDDLGRDFVFVGLVGMMDPLREEAPGAIALCREAGIRVVMITGDQPPTAAEIGRQLGLDRDESGRPRAVVHARDLERLSGPELDRAVADAGVFARVPPELKLGIVESLQRRGEVVAMTGDGVNDAPALKQADVGVAMGIKGTEVAREAADVVIADDNFATIVVAVEQGRIVRANVRKFIHYLLSCNLGEVLAVFWAILIGWPPPLGPLQILWLNLITDVFPALALALEPSAPDAMRRPPDGSGDALIDRRFAWLIGWQGAMLAALTLLAFGVVLHRYGAGADGPRRATTAAFLTLGLAQVAHAFNARSRRRTALSSGLFTNGWLWAAAGLCVALQVAAVSVPLLREVLRTEPPAPGDWGVIAACSLAPLAIVEAVKAFARSRRDAPAP